MFNSVPLPKDENLSDSIKKVLGGLPPLNIFRMLANMPNIMPAYVEFAKAMYNGKFDRKLRQMALLRVAQKIPAKYLIAQYVHVCKGLGISDFEIGAVQLERPVVSLSEEANFLCKVADELTIESNLSEDTFHEFYKRYSVEVGTELLLFLSAANMIGRFMNATRLQVESDNPLKGQSSFFPD
jgi:alkylhydroperoxidase family enzyme